MLRQSPNKIEVQLILDVGSKAGLAASIHEGYYLIGRHAECQIRPKSRSVSRRHCLLHHASGRVNLMDLDSTSGTLVNSTRLEPRKWRKLNPGDELRLGKVVFKVSVDDSHQATQPAEGNGVAQMKAGAAMHDFDVAGFLDAQDDIDREERYQAIRDGHANELDSAEDDSALPANGLEIPADVDDLDLEEELDLEEGLGLPGEQSHTNSLDLPSEDGLALPDAELDDSLDSLEAMFADPDGSVDEGDTAPVPAPKQRREPAAKIDQQEPAKKAKHRGRKDKDKEPKSAAEGAKPKPKPKPPIPPKPKRTTKVRSAPRLSLSMDGEKLKLIGAVVFAIAVFGFFGYRVYQVVSPPEVRLVEELKY